MKQGALAGIRVLDLTRVLAGPLATMMLADMGAEVIKVEEPGVGDLYRASSAITKNGESVNFLSTNRNKQSLTLALDKPEGRRILEQLVATADVLVENYRPGVTDKLGIDYASLKRINPRLVYCSITGFGADGPYRNRTAVDPIIQAESGIMGLTGEQDRGPVRIGTAVGDIYGSMLATQGILLALYARDRSDRVKEEPRAQEARQGQQVQLSLFDAAVFGLIPREGEFFATGKVFPRMGSAHPQFVPFQSFVTADGHVFIAAFHDALWKKLCTTLGVPELAADQRFVNTAGRSQHRADLLAVIEPLLAAQSSAHWVATLEAAGVPVGRINSMADVFEHPQLKHNGMVVDMTHPVAGDIKVLNNPLRMSANPASVRTPPPLLGQHSDDVLVSLGFNAEGIARLRAEGVI